MLGAVVLPSSLDAAAGDGAGEEGDEALWSYTIEFASVPYVTPNLAIGLKARRQTRGVLRRVVW